MCLLAPIPIYSHYAGARVTLLDLKRHTIRTPEPKKRRSENMQIRGSFTMAQRCSVEILEALAEGQIDHLLRGLLTIGIGLGVDCCIAFSSRGLGNCWHIFLTTGGVGFLSSTTGWLVGRRCGIDLVRDLTLSASTTSMRSGALLTICLIRRG